MVKTIQTMYMLANRLAMEKGPRVASINGEERVCYHLTKGELKTLFRHNGYNVDGITWLKYVIGWKEDWLEVAPAPETIKDPNENNWSIVFMHPNKSEYMALVKFGEEKDTRVLAVEA